MRAAVLSLAFHGAALAMTLGIVTLQASSPADDGLDFTVSMTEERAWSESPAPPAPIALSNPEAPDLHFEPQPLESDTTPFHTAAPTTESCLRPFVSPSRKLRAAPVAPKLVPLSTPSPEYPRDARRRRLEGSCLVAFTVDTTGRVASASTSESSGHETLDAAALAAVLTWTFIPPPTPLSDRVRLTFRLK